MFDHRHFLSCQNECRRNVAVPLPLLCMCMKISPARCSLSYFKPLKYASQNRGAVHKSLEQPLFSDAINCLILRCAKPLSAQNSFTIWYFRLSILHPSSSIQRASHHFQPLPLYYLFTMRSLAPWLIAKSIPLNALTGHAFHFQSFLPHVIWIISECFLKKLPRCL